VHTKNPLLDSKAFIAIIDDDPLVRESMAEKSN
jgi:hypothetical protein